MVKDTVNPFHVNANAQDSEQSGGSIPDKDEDSAAEPMVERKREATTEKIRK